MKLNIETAPVQMGGVGDQGTFRIKSSAKAFAILSSGLYSDKFRAIVRELSCNALDSHVEAGKKDIPFEVHLPTRMEPHFSIRDFGVGLNHEEVMNVYTTYFESTKQNSNDYIGALGLGSKSPFSYTNNFSVTAIKDGVKRLYSAFINEHGIPAIVQMGNELPTDECNGVEVQFAVKAEDFTKFDQAASTVLQWFTVKPTIRGKSFTIPSVELHEQDFVRGVSLRVTTRSNEDHPIAIQGNVPYPIKPSMEDIPQHLRFFFEAPLVIQFAIGELDVSANREELSYIPSTVKAIVARLAEIFQHYETYVRKLVDEQPTLWEKSVVANRLYQQKVFAPAVKQVVSAIKRQTITTNLFQLDIKHDRVGITVNIAELLKQTPVDISVSDIQSSYGRRTRTEKLTYRKGLVEPEFFISSSRASHILINDLKRGGARRVKSFAMVNPDTKFQTKGTIYTFHVLENEALLKKLVKMFGTVGLKVTQTSKLPKPVINRGVGMPRDVVDFLSFEENRVQTRRGYEFKHEWVSGDGSLAEYMDEDPTRRVYYVELRNKTIVRSKGDVVVDKSDFGRIVKIATKYKLIEKDVEIIGIRKGVITPSKRCIKLFPLLERKIKAIKVEKLTADSVASYAFNYMPLDEQQANDVYSLLNKQSPFFNFLKAIKDSPKMTKNDNEISLNEAATIACLVLGADQTLISSDTKDIELAGRRMWKEMTDIYPLLLHVSSSWSYRNVFSKEIANYILMVDKVNRMTDSHKTLMTEAA